MNSGHCHCVCCGSPHTHPSPPDLPYRQELRGEPTQISFQKFIYRRAHPNCMQIARGRIHCKRLGQDALVKVHAILGPLPLGPGLYMDSQSTLYVALDRAAVKKSIWLRRMASSNSRSLRSRSRATSTPLMRKPSTCRTRPGASCSSIRTTSVQAPACEVAAPNIREGARTEVAGVLARLLTRIVSM